MDDVTLPLLMALERLSPLERAAFLLHDVFGLDFDEVAATIERDPAACRQLASRARAMSAQTARAIRCRKNAGLQDRRGLLRRVPERRDGAPAHAARGGRHRLCRWRRQGAGARAPVTGARQRHAAVRSGSRRVFAANRSRLVRYGFINGLPGFVTVERTACLQTTALEIEDGRIVAVYVMRNPDKLQRVADRSIDHWERR